MGIGFSEIPASEFQAANPFRVRAYRNGARKIGDMSEPLAEIAGDPSRALTDIDGIGKDLALLLAGWGARLAITDLRPEPLEQVRAEVGERAALRLRGTASR